MASSSLSSPQQEQQQQGQQWWSYVFLPLCLCWRIWLSNRMPIMDCDEVYNYWEPLHFLLYGGGLQTWEYAHEYALRTYVYLYVPWVPVARLYELTTIASFIPSSLLVDFPIRSSDNSHNDKLMVFVMLKSTLAVTMALAEVSFCKTLETTKTVSPAVARWTLFVMQTSAGMAHASGALLPSTTWAVVWLWAAAAFLRHEKERFVLFAVAATLGIGWPFAVLTLVPLGLHVLLVQTKPPDNGTPGAWGSPVHVQHVVKLLLYTVMVTVSIQAVALIVDFQQYGIWTSPNLNIFRYNAQSGGDELYGVEPTSYYIKNLLLNFNGVAILAMCSAVVVMIAMAMGKQQNQSILLVLLSPLYIWLAILVPRPHKEERFLFPIYPLICFGAVITADGLLDALFSVLVKIAKEPHYRIALHGIVWIPMAVLSMLRILALHKYYAAPLSIYAALHSVATDSTTSTKTKVCTCGEWYRFPSSFTLPKNHELAFLPSSFRGQLPQPFSPFGSAAASRRVLQPFNDQNEHVPERYSQLQDCSYVIDLETSSDCRVPASATLVAKVPFLDADKTTSTLHRTLYIPGWHETGRQESTVLVYSLADVVWCGENKGTAEWLLSWMHVRRMSEAHEHGSWRNQSKSSIP
ncbi:Alpha-1,2-mannosyltransferase ALG9 [Seminavis robusta]|uniref:Mannosyltransferase n=1 Tax=Seminavis robusta TaxID=568900 RepID=A0A9N8H4W0_9STRA|nr:Alpha-1,2-mannosyltransferase ALG9 [Seminavis robusta]|eukprot:Sro72_g039900.1 Alpha-1,2-mannosyltransferase ALG9 (634) ;mRNA; r:68541-71242